MNADFPTAIREMSSVITTFLPSPRYVCNDCGNGADGRVVWFTHLFYDTTHLLERFDVHPLPFSSFSSSYAVRGEMFSSKRRSDEEFPSYHRA